MSLLRYGLIKIGRSISAGFGEILEIVCPSKCGVCRQIIPVSADVLCQSCWLSMNQAISGSYCPGCGRTESLYGLMDGVCGDCKGVKKSFKRVVRLGEYDSILRDMILGFKYAGQSNLDDFLGNMMASSVLGDDIMGDIDQIIPIPLHWRRLLRRGYNQSALLADSLRRHLSRAGWGIKGSCDLIRVRNTPAQVTLPVSRRRANLAGAFAVRPDVRYDSQHICLVDDVMTTGTTLSVAAGVLKAAGAKSVSAIVLAVADV